MKQIEANIMGQSYLLACPEGGEKKLMEAVGKVDAAMCQIRDGGRIKARERIAVLAALNLAFDQAAAPAPAARPARAGSAPAAAPEPSERLAQLVERLDAALGSDGQLI